MQNEARIDRPRMVSPSLGFASRVMAQIEARERTRARQRMAIGLGLIAAVAVVLLGLIAIWIVGWLSALAASPAAIVTALLAISPLAGDWLDAVRIAGIAVLQNTSGLILVGYALAVLCLTTLWAEIATGTFQPSLQINWGGKRK
jgi:hypothetical protein